MLESFQTAPPANAGPAAATYSHGTLHATIPYQTPRSGAGLLTVEVLNPEDEVVGRAERRLAAGAQKGTWQEEIKLEKPLGIEDLAWHRLRYRFAYSDKTDEVVEGTESISQILRMPVLHILGQQSYLTGGPAAVRVIVTDSKNETIGGAS